MIARNLTGYRIGEHHQKAKLTDSQVVDMRNIYNQWKESGKNLGYGELSKMFGCGQSTARDIITYRTRYNV